MHDRRWIVENPEEFDQSLARRDLSPLSSEVISLDTQIRQLQTDNQTMLAERNQLSKQIGPMRKAGEDSSALEKRVSELKTTLAGAEARLRDLEVSVKELLSGIPNLPADDVCWGSDESQNILIKTWSEPVNLPFEARQHDEIGTALGMDFERAAKISGARFVVMQGQMARLERAITQFMIDVQTQEHGYTEVSVPILVQEQALYGTGQLPKFAEDLYRTEQGHWLIPTAEVSLTNLVMGQILTDEALPMRLTAATPCFRSEAGAAGKDTRGMIRQHQFYKVELVSITTPEQSEEEQQRMTRCAEAVLEKLELPYRVVSLCTGDLGFGARRTFDLEVWLPGQQAYREISSCSTCGDFQARRMNARYRPAGEKKTRFVHTLNGSGLAVGRTLVAVLENYQQADGSVRIPDVLQPYMGGQMVMKPNA